MFFNVYTFYPSGSFLSYNIAINTSSKDINLSDFEDNNHISERKHLP